MLVGKECGMLIDAAENLDFLLSRQSKWDRRYMELVDHVASWSKDSSRHIGAVLVKDNRVLAVAFNGIPEGVDDTIPERSERPEKYFWYEHAERNLCYTAAANGISMKGATVYTTGVPCADCGRSFVQTRVKRVVTWKGGSGTAHVPGMIDWNESCNKTRAMLAESGIELVEVER